MKKYIRNYPMVVPIVAFCLSMCTIVGLMFYERVEHELEYSGVVILAVLLLQIAITHYCVVVIKKQTTKPILMINSHYNNQFHRYGRLLYKHYVHLGPDDPRFDLPPNSYRLELVSYTREGVGYIHHDCGYQICLSTSFVCDTIIDMDKQSRPMLFDSDDWRYQPTLWVKATDCEFDLYYFTTEPIPQ